MRILVCGSRTAGLKDTYIAMETVPYMVGEVDTIITGMAAGPDTYALRYAAQKGCAIEVYPADWEKHGKAAGFLRNTTMVDIVHVVIAVYDGKSRGTWDTIKKAITAGKVVYVFPATGE